MFGTNVLDKDGISALATMSEAAVYLRTQKLTLTDQLENIYEKYGLNVIC